MTSVGLHRVVALNPILSRVRGERWTGSRPVTRRRFFASPRKLRPHAHVPRRPGLVHYSRKSSRTFQNVRCAATPEVNEALQVARQDEHSFLLPLNYYEVLGITSGATSTQITNAHAKVVEVEMEEGYSKECAEARRALLDFVVGGLLGRLRPRYDMELRKSGKAGPPVSIPLKWLPAGLALLQEIGKPGVVVEVCRQIMDNPEVAPYKRDLTVALALSHCTLARDVLEQEQVTLACRHLNEALGEVQAQSTGSNPLAPSLCADIEAALEALVAPCVMEQIALPLVPDYRGGLAGGATDRVRAGALKALSGLIVKAEANDPAAAAVTGDYLRSAMRSMCVNEIVDLLSWSDVASAKPEDADGPGRWSSLLHTAALAHVAAGWLTFRPRLIAAALTLFEAAMEKEGEVTLAQQAACSILLGRPERAQALLEEEHRLEELRQQGVGVTETGMKADVAMRRGSSGGAGAQGVSLATTSPGPPAPGRPSLRGTLFFCQANAAPDGDLLPGMCMFTERWIAEVVMPGFRDTSSSGVGTCLNTYFEHPKVVPSLRSQDVVDTVMGLVSSVRGSVKAAANYAKYATGYSKFATASGSAPQALTAAGGGSEGDFLHLTDADGKDIRLSVESPRANASGEAGGSAGGAGRAAAPAQGSAQAAGGRLGEGPAAGENGAAAGGGAWKMLAGSTGDMPAAPPALPPAPAGPGAPAVADDSAAAPPRDATIGSLLAAAGQTAEPAGTASRAPGGPSSPAEGQAGGPVRSRAAAAGGEGPEGEQFGSKSVMAAVGVVAIATCAALFAQWQSRQAVVRGGAAPTMSTAVSSRKRRWEGANQLTAARAERLVTKWQSTKQAALGAKHKVEMLKECLCEPMLGEWQVRAQDAAARGWYWQYQLLALKINAVEVDENQQTGAETGVIDVTLQECAKLMHRDVQNTNEDKYQSTYRVRYSAVKINGEWKLSRGNIVR